MQYVLKGESRIESILCYGWWLVVVNGALLSIECALLAKHWMLVGATLLMNKQVFRKHSIKTLVPNKV